MRIARSYKHIFANKLKQLISLQSKLKLVSLMESIIHSPFEKILLEEGEWLVKLSQFATILLKGSKYKSLIVFLPTISVEFAFIIPENINPNLSLTSPIFRYSFLL